MSSLSYAGITSSSPGSVMAGHADRSLVGIDPVQASLHVPSPGLLAQSHPQKGLTGQSDPTCLGARSICVASDLLPFTVEVPRQAFSSALGTCTSFKQNSKSKGLGLGK